MKLLVCSTMVEPRYVLVGSQSDDSLVHQVIPSTVWNDAWCDCRGYLFRGYCSHITQAESDPCTWWTDALNYTGLCDLCGSKVVLFDTEPEYV